MYRIVAESFPNNEIRVTRSQLPSVTRRTDIFADDEPECGGADGGRFSVISGGGEISPSSNLSLVPNSKIKPVSAGYGVLPSKPTRFGLNAKRVLIRSGGALERSSQPHECLFLTGTLPGSTEDSFRAIAAYSGYVVNGLKAWVATFVKAKLDFYVWEWQKRGALHLHYCVHVPDDAARSAILSGFRDWWISALHRVGDKAGCDLFRRDSGYSHISDESKVRAIAEICRKSPARYLAKYLSKSANPSRGNSRFFTPSRWWGTSRPLKQLLESLSKKIEIAVDGYFGIMKKSENIYHSCDSSDSGTYAYAHKFGIGYTVVCYPNSENENTNLWNILTAHSTEMRRFSSSSAKLPSITLMRIKERMNLYLNNWLTNYSRIHSGLICGLNNYLNMMNAITLSLSEVERSQLFTWEHHTSALASILQFSPINSPKVQRDLRQIENDIYECIGYIDRYGWA